MRRPATSVVGAAAAMALALFATVPSSAGGPGASRGGFELEWPSHIPMRDGVELSANVYRPRDLAVGAAARGCIVSITPYGTERYHPAGVWFSSHSYVFVAVNSRGRGGSGGKFRPFIQEAEDGRDTVEWLAKQPVCGGKVAMWGLSYMGYVQWATIKESPAHLATIVPVAAAYPGLDFPMRDNMPYPFAARFLSLVSGTGLNERIFADEPYWRSIYRTHAEQGRAFVDLAMYTGEHADVFREWLAHPHQDAYWDAYVPTAAQLAALDIPILTITGSYDADQPGALAFYREHMQHGSAAAKARHYLVIGPWDHMGTMIPTAEFGGLKFGPASVIDTNRLHLEWYDWVLGYGERPAFLEDRVAYYVMGAEKWRYAPTLESVTAREGILHLGADGPADDVFASGRLQPERPAKASFGSYVYDPRDLSRVSTERADPDSLIDQSEVYQGVHKLLVYHSEPFERATEISGTFRLKAWISIDQPDTDFKAAVYEILPDGKSILLSTASKRARYRKSSRDEKLITTREPLLYDFDSFTFVSRAVAPGSRLRLVIGPQNSISKQRNYNSGKAVAEETAADARKVTVRLHHGGRHASALIVPIGRPEE